MGNIIGDEDTLFASLEQLIRKTPSDKLYDMICKQYDEFRAKLGDWEFWPNAESWFNLNKYREETYANDPGGDNTMIWNVTTSMLAMIIEYTKRANQLPKEA